MAELEFFHRAVRNWFEKQFPAPTEPHARAWPAIKQRRHTLIAAPPRSGKTLAAFLSAIEEPVEKSLAGELKNEKMNVYVSPLKALRNETQINLHKPPGAV